MKTTREIPAFTSFLSDAMLEYLLQQTCPVDGVPGLSQIGSISGLETVESLRFACSLYHTFKEELAIILEQRSADRDFIDAQTKHCAKQNQQQNISVADPNYQTVIGQTDHTGRTVVGPLTEGYFRATGESVAEIPDWLQPPHVTLFGPPNSARMAINAMNTWHRKMANEPAIVTELVNRCTTLPKWGADDEDSKTPLRNDLMNGSSNLAQCFKGDISFTDNGKNYQLAAGNLALPIKRIPGIAIPCPFLFADNNPLPLHIYDFALHLYRLWDNPQALTFYIPKLENEEEATYLAKLVCCAEQMISELHPEYSPGTIRLLIVLENPRAIFRTNEIMDALYPYFAGASLGWHDFLASTARLFKEDPQYRIPVKSDPEIVIKHIKASHELLARVVGPRGGIKIGGMYGVLPMDNDPTSGSFQVTIKGYFRDVITQFRRGLDGFWVAHPDFVRIGIALVQAWQAYSQGSQESLRQLINGVLAAPHNQEVLDFLELPDVESLDYDDPRFPRALIAADLAESATIANNDEQEVRYNIFQSLQYLADWLAGNGCVALPASLEGEQVRVMDDLATAERSRWEVWHEVYHGRVERHHLLKIALQEYDRIRLSPSDSRPQVQVQWDKRTARWYPVALRLMLLMMTQSIPVEFASELLLPFTVDAVRQAEDPWEFVQQIDPEKYTLEPDFEQQVAIFLHAI
ncbi:aldolase/citrate lyase/malate synthase family protein [Desulfogranum japonicum]|uniref:hypothetical protein n=1 Tax=Desulfogranum japonicum TaxID=231447 RepID=UPI0003FB00DE|nr:hypothetical protein [Desulfogranum japonicum]